MTAPRQGYPPLEADTLPKYLKLGKERWGNRVFMLTKKLGIWKRFTWNQVYEQVKAFSLGLMKLGLIPGETVAVAGDNELELYWAQYAVQAAGGRLVFIYPDMTAREAKYLIEDSQSLYVVAEDQEQVDKVLEIRDELPNLRKIIYWDSRGMWHYDDPFLMEKAPKEARTNPFRPLRRYLCPDLHSGSIDESSYGACIEHSCLNCGCHTLPLSGPEAEDLRADFPDVRQNGFRFLRKVIYKRPDEPGGQKELLRGPCGGNVGEVTGERPEIVRHDHSKRVVQQIIVGQDHALGKTCSA